MSEIISLHVGQCGVQFGNSIWELFCLEHNIQPNGQIIQKLEEDNCYLNFFSEIDGGLVSPRSVFIDLEQQAINEVKTGKCKELLKPSQFICGKENAASNFARGYYSIGNQYIDISLERIRQEVEKCSCLQGIIIFNSVGGGTGSGLGSLLLERLQDEFIKKTRMGINIYPFHKNGTSLIEPYNSILATQYLQEYTDVCITLDNQAIYEICKNTLDIENPNYKNLNRLISQVYSSLTSSLRFKGSLFSNMSEFQTQLVIHPRLHFMLSSYSPILSNWKTCFLQPRTIDITQWLFEPENMMAKCNISKGKFMACSIQYRGDVVPRDVRQALAELAIKNTIEFVDWCPNQLKVGITYKDNRIIPGGEIAKVVRSASMISNTTAIKDVFSKLNKKYDKMLSKRAFCHWYIQEGMEESQFFSARQELATLEKDYQEAYQQLINEEEEVEKVVT